jgi:hypothetical protein
VSDLTRLQQEQELRLRAEARSNINIESKAQSGPHICPPYSEASIREDERQRIIEKVEGMRLEPEYPDRHGGYDCAIDDILKAIREGKS